MFYDIFKNSVLNVKIWNQQ